MISYNNYGEVSVFNINRNNKYWFIIGLRQKVYYTVYCMSMYTMYRNKMKFYVYHLLSKPFHRRILEKSENLFVCCPDRLPVSNKLHSA